MNHHISAAAFRAADPASFDRVIESARSGSFSDDDIADLATTLANSGSRLELRKEAVDLSSTGGPGSLSTLLGPLWLRTSGAVVPTVGVPGRPAGGVDVLFTVPGFRRNLSRQAAADALDRCGIVHAAAGETWAPLDAALFAYRVQASAVDVPPLAIASLLSKKIAAGVKNPGLDVRVAPHGNLGTTYESARTNARRYNRVAQILGLNSVCALTDASVPQQPFIGRGEALRAVSKVVEGAGGWLAEHARACADIARVVLAASGTGAVVDAAELRRSWSELLQAHGTSIDAVEQRVAAVATHPIEIVRATRDGYIDVNMAALRRLLVAKQAQDQDRYGCDPAGVTLLTRPGDEVRHRDPIARIRTAPYDGDLVRNLAACLSVVDMPATPKLAVEYV